MAEETTPPVDKSWILPLPDKFRSGKIPPILISILSQRGLTSEQEAEDFLNIKYENLSLPSQIKGMNEAVGVIEKAISEKKRIAIYGDYDVDGVSATALLVRFFEIVGLEVSSYIPSRQEEGYGLNKSSIERMKKDQIDLVITVDCGSSSIKEIAYAKKIGLEVVVTDHHEITKINDKEILPDCIVVNPKRTSNENKVNELAGVGVAFCLIRALQKNLIQSLPEGQEKWFLDLVALGTICDIVPLSGDNRILAKYGLKVLGKSRNLGLQALIQSIGLENKRINSYNVGFGLGPRLNAAGRLKNASLSLQLLLEKDEHELNEISIELNELNQLRQKETERIVSEAKAVIVENKYEKNRKIFLLKSKDWPAGIIGIAASRLADRYHRPILIMEEEKEMLKGSARSIKEFDLIRALDECRELFIKYGGHSQAAGFTMKKTNFKALEAKLIKISDKLISWEDLVPEIKIDCRLSFKNIDQELIDNLEKLEPFGCGNNKPRFMTYAVNVYEKKLVGKEKNHLKLVLKDGAGYKIPGMYFNFGPNLEKLKSEIVDIIYTVELNEWNNTKNIDLHIIDMKESKEVVQN